VVAQRRERPPQQHGGKAFEFRLSDGRTISMPAAGPSEPAAADSCCFCGEDLEAGGEQVGVVVRWTEASEERSQGWSAHRSCMAARLHESVLGSGPFFGA
jgi:hypothetical protein